MMIMIMSIRVIIMTMSKVSGKTLVQSLLGKQDKNMRTDKWTDKISYVCFLACGKKKEIANERSTGKEKCEGDRPRWRPPNLQLVLIMQVSPSEIPMCPIGNRRPTFGQLTGNPEPEWNTLEMTTDSKRTKHFFDGTFFEFYLH